MSTQETEPDKSEKPDSPPSFEAVTGRLKELTTFLAHFAPAIGERSGFDVEIDAGRSVEDARDSAILAAFKAVDSIALKSA